MEIVWEGGLGSALTNLIPERSLAIIDAVVKFSTEPDAPALGFRPIPDLANHFLITSRRGDFILLRKEAAGYAVVDVGAYSSIMARIGN